ncbi:MAG: thiamine pyrophosphate-binding protein [Candidatus Latescibacterota bacterium]|nr:thiamine pyrophosphate-binding protein [Candidatus Latescibacterota bacterium]
MTGSRFLAETLSSYGVTAIFWMPAALKQSLMEMESLGIRRVLCHSEKGAAYMADGYARISRRPGIVMAQSVGAANLAAGLQDAFLGMSPVIAITGRQGPERRHRNAYQEIDHWPLFAPVTKSNVFVDTPEQLPYLLRQAFRDATTEAPGPVHLELSGIRGEYATEPVGDFEVVVEDRFIRAPAIRVEPETEAIDAAVTALAEVDRPVIVAGGGAVTSGAHEEIAALAEHLEIPVVTSLNGKSIIPARHRLNVGVAGTYSRWCANEAIADSDLVIFVGSHTSDQITNVWTLPGAGARVLQIDIDPRELGRNYPAAVAVHADARIGCRRLLEASRSAGLLPKAPRANIERNKVEWAAELECHLRSDSSPIRPERLCWEITKALPENAVLVSDTGWTATWAGTMIDLEDQPFIRCAGSLGWGFPGALGVKCAVPDRPVICFTGDGGFWYHLSELETAVRAGIGTTTVINNNGSLAQDRAGVLRAYEGASATRQEELYTYGDVDFAALAVSWGARGYRVESAVDVGPALRQAIAEPGPTVVDVVTDRFAEPPRPRK